MGVGCERKKNRLFREESVCVVESVFHVFPVLQTDVIKLKEVSFSS